MGTNVEAAGGLWVHGLWQEGYHWYSRGLSTLIVQVVIFLWRGFNYVKILERNVINPRVVFAVHLCAKGGEVPPSVFYMPYSCEHQIHIHTWQLMPFFLAATVVTLDLQHAAWSSWIFFILSSSPSSSPFH
jgi:hypothetical protein